MLAAADDCFIEIIGWNFKAIYKCFMNKPNGSLPISVLCKQTGLQEYTDFLNLQYLKTIFNENLCNKFISYFCL